MPSIPIYKFVPQHQRYLEPILHHGVDRVGAGPLEYKTMSRPIISVTSIAVTFKPKVLFFGNSTACESRCLSHSGFSRGSRCSFLCHVSSQLIPPSLSPSLPSPSLPCSCWLRLDTNFIWSFIGPATLIIMVRHHHRVPAH